MKRNRPGWCPPPLRALLIAWALSWLPAHATTGEPVALNSPAWRALMAQPVVQDDTLAYHAAALAGAWGRPAEKAVLVNALLQLHGLGLAGQPLPATLAELLARPPANTLALQAAWDAGLNHTWGQPDWEAEALPAGLAEGAQPWPGRPGFWRLPGGRLAARPAVQNRSKLVIVLPGPLQLQLLLQGGDAALALDCTLQRGSVRLMPGERARWWCATRGAVPAQALAAEHRALWSTAVPVPQADLDRWIDQLAGRPPAALAGLSGLYDDCRRLPNCGQGTRAAGSEPSARWQAYQAERDEEDRRSLQRELKQRASERWFKAALVVAGFGIYVLVARAFGTFVATGASLLLVLGVTGWFASRTDGGLWGVLAVAMAFGYVLMWGVVVVAAYHLLYRVFINRR